MKLSSDNGSITLHRLQWGPARTHTYTHKHTGTYVSGVSVWSGRYPGEGPGLVHTFPRSRARLWAEGEGGCQGGSGTVDWTGMEGKERGRRGWRGGIVAPYTYRWRLFMLADGHLCCTHIALRGRSRPSLTGRYLARGFDVVG